MYAGFNDRLAPRPVVPQAVVRAIRFMHSNLGTRLSVTEIAAAAGASERTLRRQFKRFTGQSPSAFHRGLRLEAAHRALRVCDRKVDVTSVAADHGFIHFGQFAARYRQRFDELPSQTRQASLAKSDQSALAPIRDRVTLVVRDFVAGLEAERVALAGALTDAAISALGRTRWLEIVDGDRPGTPVRARYELRGRIATLGSRLQIAVRLVETASLRHLWGTSFEGPAAVVSGLWRRAIEGIAVAVPAQLRATEAGRAALKPKYQSTVDDLIAAALVSALKLSPEANAHALDDIDRALSLDPGHPVAMALASWVHAQRAIYNFSGRVGAERDEARRFRDLAFALDNDDAQVLAILGTSSSLVGDLDRAEELTNRCLSIDPYCTMAWQRRGWLATYRGAGAPLADFRRCLALGGGHEADRHNVLFGIATAHFVAGRYDRAADWALRGIQEQPSAAWAYRIAAPAQALCGRRLESRKSAALLLQHNPDQTVSAVVASLPMRPEVLARYAEGLEAAGVPI